MSAPNARPAKRRRCRSAALQAGDVVAVVAPASSYRPRHLEEGLALLDSWGFKIGALPDPSRRCHYLAGDDETRARELIQALTSPSIKAVFAARGGYGCARLIPFLDRLLDGEKIRQQPPLLVGYSDITLLHLYLHRLGLRSIHGPMMAEKAIGSLDPRDRDALHHLLTDPRPLPPLQGAGLYPLVEGEAQGILVGGCLSLVVSTLGTGYEINTRNKILFLEEVGEAPYRVDRMLTQLEAAGKLSRLAGILLGDFEACRNGEEDYDWRLPAAGILGRLPVPVLAGLPCGHGPRKFPLPLGTRVRIESRAKAERSRVIFQEGVVEAIAG